ncbi:hypothetical protein CCHL11_02033 [Colletotrichum chlorophyti]|uniref:Cupin type-2 domain-containing protein n=1 Tax=Colletotrichum chlorophyti TaxID=708187 RepID=A0A1Q8S6G7_9PEZI|nr:hypothetical protein CCHL11_02033 [Colletotrichum chlorophyti]
MSAESLSELPPPQRVITTHNDKGLAVYAKDFPETLEFWGVRSHTGEPGAFGLGYVTRALPVSLTSDSDMADFREADAHRQRSGLVQHGGTVLRYVDFAPNSASPMHRTASLDYGIVIKGELMCELDSGERRLLKPGDVAIQRGTMHQWLNVTDSWARMVFMLIHATEPEVGGKKLSEDLGGMQGVPSSH